MDSADIVEDAILMADEYLGRENSKITVIPDGVAVIVRNRN